MFLPFLRSRHSSRCCTSMSFVPLVENTCRMILFLFFLDWKHNPPNFYTICILCFSFSSYDFGCETKVEVRVTTKIDDYTSISSLKRVNEIFDNVPLEYIQKCYGFPYLWLYEAYPQWSLFPFNVEVIYLLEQVLATLSEKISLILLKPKHIWKNVQTVRKKKNLSVCWRGR